MGDAVFNLLNQTHVDLNQLVSQLNANPDLAHHVGNHSRSTVWVCVQKDRCTPNHLAALTILAGPPYRVDLDKRAGNGKTPRESAEGRAGAAPAAAAAHLAALGAQ